MQSDHHSIWGGVCGRVLEDSIVESGEECGVESRGLYC